jgi:hypothetical protein
MRRLAQMESIMMTNTTQITRVRFASPQIADRNLSFGADRAMRGAGLSSVGFGVLGGLGSDLRTPVAPRDDSFYAPSHKADAVKDVVYLRSWSPPV